MARILSEVFKDTLIISGFVLTMMLIVEYINVLTTGSWMERLSRSRPLQYILSAFLGALPGCLGPYIVVTLYSHRIVTLGALVAAMVATSGDESFVMLALFPQKALILFGALFVTGLLAGIVVDLFIRRPPESGEEKHFEMHLDERCNCFPTKAVLGEWRNLSLARGVLSSVLLLLLLSFILGELGPEGWDWMRVTMIFVSGFGLFIVSTVPEHFLKEHLWEHIVKKHFLSLILWTVGALVVVEIISHQLNISALITDNVFSVLIIASLVGLIPTSGPHLVFVTLFAQGTLPFSVLFASSIVQDGHGMIPLLAHSRKDFALVKLINLAIGLALGALTLAMGV
ncbi:MAG: putative manganese transporter [Myxococcota bacterium]